ncbi:unnamed protein product [Amoebophrya sp. A25]|nr:unnamed protein product [Amoebophrya sp. A25]|eukprot:GSA25T00001527001.1
MSSFSDTFTKNQDQEELLNYDSTAAYYFGATVLLCFLLPWTYAWVNFFLYGSISPASFPKKTPKLMSAIKYCRNQPMVENLGRIEAFASKKMGKAKRWYMLKLAVLGMMWLTWLHCCYQLAGDSGEGTVKGFNPFEILGLEPGVDDRTIKKAYREKSLLYHPDKNPGDPLANAKFLQVAKALKALTDPAAKANYEKYGNPDGPQTTKVGIGLPRFLLEKQNHMLILCIFFITFLIVIPAVFIVYYQRQKEFAPSGVRVETLQLLGHYIQENTRVRNCPELIAASAESRNMEMYPFGADVAAQDAAMKALAAEITDVPAKSKFDKQPLIMRNNHLLLAHMQRLHHLLTPELRWELDELLLHVERITTSMIEIACMREWLETAKAVIDFRRSIVQALDWKSNSLLQIPHFTDECVKHCTKGNNPIKEITAFLTREKSLRRGVVNMSEEELLDIDDFVQFCTQASLEVDAAVEGEKTICKDDVATITVKITRTNLEEGEALGYVHAPFYPDLKKEEWYIFLTEGSKIICWEKVRSDERVIVEKMRFHVGRKGKHTLQVQAFCDSYQGIDQAGTVTFDALNPDDDESRFVYVHPEDEKLDEHPTLFQQLVGDMGPGDESEDEEDESGSEEGNSDAKKGDNAAGGNGDGSESDSSSSSDSSSDDEK